MDNDEFDKYVKNNTPSKKKGNVQKNILTKSKSIDTSKNVEKSTVDEVKEKSVKKTVTTKKVVEEQAKTENQKEVKTTKKPVKKDIVEAVEKVELEEVKEISKPKTRKTPIKKETTLEELLDSGVEAVEDILDEVEEEPEVEKPTKTRTRKKSKKEMTLEDYNTNYVTKTLEQTIHESMIPYSEFVILDRALPRVEDGLKPVQRRVLYSMLEVGVLPDRPYKKCATIVGECMGKYHPHGDSSIYETLVRLAQPFNMAEPLVDGHGNFGSIDGDCAAAMRYTEAKLTPLALELLRDLEKDTVTWSLNFDDRLKEPNMLPGRFPNLLVNGCQGIAVGLATNIPTHNFTEACNAVIAYIDNKNITLEQLMEIMPLAVA